MNKIITIATMFVNLFINKFGYITGSVLIGICLAAIVYLIKKTISKIRYN